jgi:hypothetical protein
MKLEHMPLPLMAEGVDEYVGPVWEVARLGDDVFI